MAYRDFTLNKLEESFSITSKIKSLFSESDITPTVPDVWLSRSLEMGQKLRFRSEKMRSEVIVTPILLYLKGENSDFFTIYSGERFFALSKY